MLTGTLDALTNPTTTAAQVRQLVERLAQLVDLDEPAVAADPHTPLPPTVRDTAHKHHPGFGATARTLPLALFAAADTAGSIDWDGRSPERDRIRVSTRGAEPVPRQILFGRSVEKYFTAV